jgi:hypothetical protein
MKRICARGSRVNPQLHYKQQKKNEKRKNTNWEKKILAKIRPKRMESANQL